MAYYAKAIIGAASAFVASLVTALGDNTISGQEWLTAVAAALVALGVVYAVPNKPQEAPK